MNAVRAELRKLLTLPAVPGTALATVGAALLLGRDALPALQAGFLVLGVLATTHEYTGQFRSTLLAVPRRLHLAAAKAIALTMVTAPAAVTVAPRATAYLIGTTLLAAAVGTVIRHGVPAVAVLLAGYLIAAPLLRGWYPATAPWLPDTALTDPAGGAPAAVAWTAGALLGAAIALRRRDA